MTDFDKLIGKDESAEYLRMVRVALGDSYPHWKEIEPILYETFKEFEAHPDFNTPLQFAGMEKLTADEQASLGRNVAQVAAVYGRECRSALLAPLAIARVQLWALQKQDR
jgi:hypothetical protein